MTKTKKEPLVRIAKRNGVSGKKKIVVYTLAVLSALLIDGLFIYFVTGLNPIGVYKAMFEGTFQFNYGTKLFISKFLRTINDMAMLLGISIALAPAFKMKFWNIGAEGQVLIGGLITAICMQNFGDKLPTALLFIVMIAASMIAGALWGVIPAVFKAKWNTNETLFTLMMNYIAINIVACLTNIWRGDKSSMGTINQTTNAGWLPSVFGQSFMINIFVILALTFLMFFYLKFNKQGYEIAVVGESVDTAKYAGINVKRVIIRTMCLSGAICGLCGFLAVSGKDHTISTNTAGGYGFTAIIVAWMAKFNTFYMALIAFLIAFLQHGASEIASSYSKMNSYAADVISGIILFFLIGCEFFINYRMIFRKKEAK